MNKSINITKKRPLHKMGKLLKLYIYIYMYVIVKLELESAPLCFLTKGKR